MRRLLPLLLLLPLIGAPLNGQGSLSTESKTDSCFRVSLEVAARPGYTSSGAWINPEELVLVDAVNNNLLTIDPEGHLVRKQSKDVEDTVTKTFRENFLPVAVVTGTDGVWLELVGARMAKLSGTEKVMETVDLWGTQIDSVKFGGAWRWTLAGDDIFGLGQFQLRDKSETAGFFRIDLNDPSKSTLLRIVPDGSTTQLWYRIGLPLVTSLGETGYALSMERPVSIVKSSPGAKKLEPLGTFTALLKAPPALLPFEDAGDFQKIMKKLTSSTAPMGLHGWNGKLYLLWRYQSQDRSKWLLSRIDPERPHAEMMEATVTLSSEANELITVPGPRYWAFVEQGPVEGYLTQSTNSILFVPTARVQEAFIHGQALCE